MKRSRYAPSPTGYLHLGNLSTALVYWLHAKLIGARTILRMEDLDRPRVKEESRMSILRDLEKLGFTFDEAPGEQLGLLDQSQRISIYQHYFQKAKEQGLIYPCTCSRREVQARAGSRHPKSGEWHYSGHCRSSAIRQDRKPAWRIRTQKDPIHFVDGVFGNQCSNLEEEIGDFIICRSDGTFAYQFACAIDELEMGITHVVRGADLLGSTARQIYVMKLFGGSVPHYWHVPIIVDSTGKKLSKRDGSDSLSEWIQNGGTPASLLGHCAFLLGLQTVSEPTSVSQLLDSLTVEKLQEILNHKKEDQLKFSGLGL